MAYQAALPLFDNHETLYPFAEGAIEERGAIYTRREVVDFILDLIGYTPDRSLHHYRVLEPSFGQGDFLVPLVERLLQAYLSSPDAENRQIATLLTAVRGVELH